MMSLPLAVPLTLEMPLRVIVPPAPPMAVSGGTVVPGSVSDPRAPCRRSSDRLTTSPDGSLAKLTPSLPPPPLMVTVEAPAVNRSLYGVPLTVYIPVKAKL